MKDLALLSYAIVSFLYQARLSHAMSGPVSLETYRMIGQFQFIELSKPWTGSLLARTEYYLCRYTSSMLLIGVKKGERAVGKHVTLSLIKTRVCGEFMLYIIFRIFSV